jgi:hypothetical protein
VFPTADRPTNHHFAPRQYAVYENGALARVALFNYITDPSGASDYKATISVSGGSVPASVQVKYFLSDSVSTKDNMTWAGQVRLVRRLGYFLRYAKRDPRVQTLGTIHEVDGRLKNDLNIVTIACNTSANTCVVPVPAPAFALVFLGTAETIATATFSTSVYTNTANTATIAASVLSTSNGMSGKTWELGSTSSGSDNAAARGRVSASIGNVVLGAAVLGLVLSLGL